MLSSHHIQNARGLTPPKITLIPPSLCPSTWCITTSTYPPLLQPSIRLLHHTRLPSNPHLLVLLLQLLLHVSKLSRPTFDKTLPSLRNGCSSCSRFFSQRRHPSSPSASGVEDDPNAYPYDVFFSAVLPAVPRGF